MEHGLLDAWSDLLMDQHYRIANCACITDSPANEWIREQIYRRINLMQNTDGCNAKNVDVI